MENASRPLLVMVILTLVAVVGLSVYLFNRKPDQSPPPVLAGSDETLQRTVQRSFVNFNNVFQAEDYDIGGPEVAFHIVQKDTGAGAKYRSDGANIYPEGEGYYVSHLNPGD